MHLRHDYFQRRSGSIELPLILGTDMSMKSNLTLRTCLSVLLITLVSITTQTLANATPQEDLENIDHCETLLTGFSTFTWNFTEEQRAYYQEMKAKNDPNLRHFLDDILMKVATTQILKLPSIQTQIEESQAGKRDSVMTAGIPETSYENSIELGLALLLKIERESTAINKLLATNSFIKWGIARFRWRQLLSNEKYRIFFESEMHGSSLSYLTMVLDTYDRWGSNYWGKDYWKPEFIKQKEDTLESWKELHTSLPHMTRFSFQLMALKMQIEFMNRYRLQNIQQLRAQLELEIAKP